MRKRLFLSLLALYMSSCVSVVLIKDPLSWEEHLNLGYIYERQGKLDLAEQEYKKAIKKNKKGWLAYYNLGNVYVKKGDWEKAEEFYKKALKIEKDPDTMNNLAYILNRRGEHCSALELIDRALRKRDIQEYRETKEEIERALKDKGIVCSHFEWERELW